MTTIIWISRSRSCKSKTELYKESEKKKLKPQLEAAGPSLISRPLSRFIRFEFRSRQLFIDVLVPSVVNNSFRRTISVISVREFILFQRIPIAAIARSIPSVY